MFIGYVNKTTKQYKVYTLDLQTIIKSSVIDFKEETKGKTIDLNLLGEHLQGTPNVLTIHKLIKRLKELLLSIVDLPPKEKLNNFKIIIPLQTPKSTTQLINALVNLSSKGLKLIGFINLLVNLPSKELEPAKSTNPLKGFTNKILKQAAP
jgi:hypothetical protein